MLTYISTVTGVMLVTLLLHRQIIIALYWLALLICGAFALRIVITLLPELDHNGFWPSTVVGGLLGFVVIGILCAGGIRQAIIWFYLQEQIERSKQAAAKGKLW